jgi:hypothetical protein
MSNWGNRICSACGKDLGQDEYSRNQWSKGVGVSRCTFCVQELFPIDCDGFGTARNNDATRALFEHGFFEEGTFRYVGMGKYTHGSRTGQSCVRKWFKDGNHFSAAFYSKDIEAVEKSLQIITQWNEAGFIGSTIRINRPQVWNDHEYGTVLVEPFIDGYQKFNSNSGNVMPFLC